MFNDVQRFFVFSHTRQTLHVHASRFSLRRCETLISFTFSNSFCTLYNINYSHTNIIILSSSAQQWSCIADLNSLTELRSTDRKCVPSRRSACIQWRQSYGSLWLLCHHSYKTNSLLCSCLWCLLFTVLLSQLVKLPDWGRHFCPAWTKLFRVCYVIWWAILISVYSDHRSKYFSWLSGDTFFCFPVDLRTLNHNTISQQLCD